MLMLPFSIMAQNITIRGNIINMYTEAAISGVKVTQYGTTNSTITDAGGNYEISAPPNARLLFEHANLCSVLMSIKGQETMNIRMKKGDPSKVITYFELTGHIFDSKTNAPIENVKITQDDSELSTTTNKDGNYSIVLSNEDDPDMEFRHKKYYIEKRTDEGSHVIDILMTKISAHEISITGGYFAWPKYVFDYDADAVDYIVSASASYMHTPVNRFSIGAIYARSITSSGKPNDSYSASYGVSSTLSSTEYNSFLACLRFQWHYGTHLRIYSKLAAGLSSYDWEWETSSYEQNKTKSTSHGTTFDFHVTAFGLAGGSKHLKLVIEIGFGSCGFAQGGISYQF